MRYRVRALVTISISTVVEDADSPEQAIEIASERELPGIHEYGERQDAWATSGELDGEPVNLTAEEEPA